MLVIGGGELEGRGVLSVMGECEHEAWSPTVGEQELGEVNWGLGRGVLIDSLVALVTTREKASWQADEESKVIVLVGELKEKT